MARRWLLWVLAIAFVWLVVTRYAEIEQLSVILSTGRWPWVLAAVVLVVAYYLVYTALYQSAFEVVDVRSRVRELLPVVLAALFLNVAAPTGGASGTALFVDDAVRRKQSAARTAAGVLLEYIAMFCAFLLILAVGMTVLFISQDLQTYEVIAALLLLLLVSGLTGVLLLGLWNVVLLREMLGWVQRAVNGLTARLKRPDFLDESWADRNTLQFMEAAQEIAAHPQRLVHTLSIALMAHLVNLTCLYTLFLAFDQPVEFGILVAGYSMAILFWIVSPTPQGIGVVEGVMALVFTSLHVPATRATVIALAFRGLTFWLPFALGFVLLERVKSFGGERRSRAQAWNVRAIAVVIGLLGAVNVISAVTPPVAERLQWLEQVLPLEVRVGSRWTAALAGFGLLLMAGNLWRRKQAAWWLTLGVLTVSIASHLLKGLDFEEIGVSLVLVIWLLLQRHHFHARSDLPSIQQGAAALRNALLFTLAYGITGFYLLDRHFRISFSLLAAFRQTVMMFTAWPDPGYVPITSFGRYFADSIYAVGAGALGYALVMLLRPVLIRQPASTAERAWARLIVEEYGASSLARFALFDDKSYFFSPSGESVIAYAAKGRAAVALGDPIGPVEDASSAITAFCQLCAHNDWQPAFYQTLPDYLPLYQQAGLQAVCIGHEAIVPLEQFTLQGGANKPLRTAVNRLTRLGQRARLYSPPLSEEIIDELQEVSDEWLADRHDTEMRFSVGWFDDEYMRGSQVMAVHAAADPSANGPASTDSVGGDLMAFANLTPAYRKNEVGIDLMRHRRKMENGTMEFLFVSLLQWAKEQGFATFSLGLSALAGVGETPQAPAVERALHYVYEHVHQFYNFRGLHEFKEKFHPDWSPRYLVYPGAASLPEVGLALARADAGDLGMRDMLRALRR